MARVTNGRGDAPLGGKFFWPPLAADILPPRVLPPGEGGGLKNFLPRGYYTSKIRPKFFYLGGDFGKNGCAGG